LNINKNDILNKLLFFSYNLLFLDMVNINWVIVFQFLSNDMQIIHGLVDRVMEKNGVPFVSPGDKSGYYIERSDVSA